MTCRAVSYQILLLPVSVMLADGQGCLQLATGGPLGDLFCPAGCAKPLASAPLVETLVAEPQAAIKRHGLGQVASAENRARTAFELTMPQGHTLVVALLGQADWSQGAQGTIGFYLAVQQHVDETWETIGSDGVSGSRTGQASARGRAVVPLRLEQPGVHRLRVIVRSVADSSQACDAATCPSAEDRDIVEIDVTVLTNPQPKHKPLAPPAVPQDDGWLQPDPPRFDEMLP